jgi:hypothetical protein
MLTLIFTTALLVLTIQLGLLWHILLKGKPDKDVKRYIYGSQHIFFTCTYCGSPIETKFNNNTDRVIEHIFCPCCGEPEKVRN